MYRMAARDQQDAGAPPFAFTCLKRTGRKEVHDRNFSKCAFGKPEHWVHGVRIYPRTFKSIRHGPERASRDWSVLYFGNTKV